MLKLSGIHISEFKKFTISGYPATLLVGYDRANKEAYSVSFGDSTFYVTITSYLYAGNKTVEAEIEASRNSIVYDKQFPIDPYEGTGVSINESLSKFKFLRHEQNMYEYAIGGLENTEAPKYHFVWVDLKSSNSHESPREMVEN